MAELTGAWWQRCGVHFERSLWAFGSDAFVVLVHVPQSERKVIAEGPKEVFSVRRRSTSESLAQVFIERYRERFKWAVEVFSQGLDEALTDLDFPSDHQRPIKGMNLLEQLFRARPGGLVFW